MSINERICELIEHEHLTVASFARRIGVGDQTVRSVCVVKRNKPSFDFIEAIIQTFAWLNAEWLITGEGEMEKPADGSGDSGKSLDLNPLIDYMRGKDNRIEELIEERTMWKIKYENAMKSMA